MGRGAKPNAEGRVKNEECKRRTAAADTGRQLEHRKTERKRKEKQKEENRRDK